MSFTTAISGINAQSEKLNAAGNNIANSQTVGYKSSSVRFADVFAASRGIGVSVSDTRQDFSQGSIERTNRNLDLAIAGGGFYRLEQASGEVGYSRSGEFSLTSDGYIVNAQGDRLTGYGLDTNVDQNEVREGRALPFPFTDVLVGGAPQALRVPSDDLPAKQTSEVAGVYNFNSEAVPGEGLVTNRFRVGAAGGSQADLNLNYHFSNNYTTYDSLGNAREVTTYFEKVADNTWLATVAVDGQLQGSGGGAFDPTGDDTPQVFLLNFNQNGQLLTKADVIAAGVAAEPNTSFDALANSAVLGVTQVSDAFTYTRPNAASPFVRNSNIFDVDSGGRVTATTARINEYVTNGSDVFSGSEINITIPGVQGANNPFTYAFDFAGSSQFANASQQNELTQNGYTSGALAGISVTNEGVVMRNFTNDQSRPAGQISLASFRNEEGLEPLGNNLWAATSTSGLANLGVAGTGQYGQIQAGAVEASNVDLAKELVDMIVAQRAYQANSNTISTQDELLQTIINL
ncbi:flagellar hook protein FlgE [Halomonas dongshanensis]|uniref:Flagellar hook protein FlgE n=1 Tax=Halomonas dongshanensis TaxID=2890835 RepID=A0ABT2EF66_9GAMM|nr:flagellar hook protein FlgE [Halomonas dongshanensis]MCS2610228.1 flagellar hook protein FlgE [Halomonas dongshanensis]